MMWTPEYWSFSEVTRFRCGRDKSRTVKRWSGLFDTDVEYNRQGCVVNLELLKSQRASAGLC